MSEELQELVVFRHDGVEMIALVKINCISQESEKTSRAERNRVMIC